MKLSWKIFRNTILLVLLALSLGGTILISMTFQNSISFEAEKAKAELQSMQREIVLLMTNDSRSPYLEESKILEYSIETMEGNWKEAGILYQIINEDGTVLSQSGGILFRDNIAVNPTVYKSVYSIYPIQDSYYLQMTSVLQLENSTVILKNSRDISPAFILRKDQQSFFLQIILIVGIVCAFLNFLLVLWISRPLYQLIEAVKKMQRGDYSARVDQYSKDEIGVLSENFNQMAQKLEENILELKEAARRKEEFVGSFAHEIKTPLTSMIGYADLLRRKQLEGEAFFTAANYIFSEGKRLEILSIKLMELLVEKSASPDYSKLPISRLLKEAITVMQSLLDEKNIQLTTNIEDFTVRADENLMKTVLINILDNARKAVEINGRLHIEAKATDNKASITITDNGKGIASEEIPKIQEAFYRVDKSRSRQEGGVGLGLAICSNIMELHNGRLLFESEVGKGTKVTVIWEGVIND